MTDQPNPNNPSPEMIELLPTRCVRAWEKIASLMHHSTDDAVMVIEQIAQIAEDALAMQAQQPNPSPADELSDNKLPLIDRLLYTAKTDTNTSVARTAAEAVTALTTLQARLDAVETALRKYADLQAKARMTPEEVADARRTMEALAKDGEV